MSRRCWLVVAVCFWMLWSVWSMADLWGTWTGNPGAAWQAAEDRATSRRWAEQLAVAGSALAKATGEFDFDAGLRALEAKNYRKAIEELQLVANRPFPEGPYAKQARRKLDEIEVLASQQLQGLDRLIEEERFQEALTVLLDVKRTFVGSRAAALAKARLEELSKSPALAAAVKRAAAEDLLSDAALYSDGGNLLRGVACYQQVAQHCAGTPQGEKAQEALAAFARDEEFQKRLKASEADARCNSLLSLARSYRANRLFDAASKNYQQVLDEFPNSQLAPLASKELEVLAEERKGAGQ